VTTEVRTFQTTTADLLRLSEWLAANECTHVAMKATGVYWKPVWHILDDGEFALVLANAAHVKNVPGRKTDVNDAMWLAESSARGVRWTMYGAPFKANFGNGAESSLLAMLAWNRFTGAMIEPMPSRTACIATNKWSKRSPPSNI
jgi:hypothetical protein